jgi:hypothetical protein
MFYHNLQNVTRAYRTRPTEAGCAATAIPVYSGRRAEPNWLRPLIGPRAAPRGQPEKVITPGACCEVLRPHGNMPRRRQRWRGGGPIKISGCLRDVPGKDERLGAYCKTLVDVTNDDVSDSEAR